MIFSESGEGTAAIFEEDKTMILQCRIIDTLVFLKEICIERYK